MKPDLWLVRAAGRTLLAITCWLCLATTALAADLLVRDVTIIDAASGAISPRMDVEIDNGVIRAVRPHRWWRQAHGQVVDGRGRFLIPGLWDAHVHLSHLREPVVPLFIALGVTSVRDMGGDIRELTSWRARIESGELTGPRVRFCGPMLEGLGEFDENHESVASPAAAREAVSRLAALGVDCIKIRTYQDEATYHALLEAAREAGLPVFGHAPFALNPVDAARLGQVSFEHAFYPYPFHTLAEDERLAVMRAYRENDIRIVPTLVAWAPATRPFEELERTYTSLTPEVASAHFVSPSLLGKWEGGLEDSRNEGRGSPGWQRAISQAGADVGEMHRGGVIVLAGTDLGAPFVAPESAIYEELERLVAESGFTPLDALRAATIEPARLFGQEAQLGSIRQGMLADLVLLDANPLEDISNIRSVHTVIAAGRAYDPAARAEIRRRAAQGVSELWSTP